MTSVVPFKLPRRLPQFKKAKSLSNLLTTSTKTCSSRPPTMTSIKTPKTPKPAPAKISTFKNAVRLHVGSTIAPSSFLEHLNSPERRLQRPEMAVCSKQHLRSQRIVPRERMPWMREETANDTTFKSCAMAKIASMSLRCGTIQRGDLVSTKFKDAEDAFRAMVRSRTKAEWTPTTLKSTSEASLPSSSMELSEVAAPEPRRLECAFFSYLMVGKLFVYSRAATDLLL
ncbi:unnamed protein product [Aphanomyces euteiches]